MQDMIDKKVPKIIRYQCQDLVTHSFHPLGCCEKIGQFENWWNLN